MSAEPGPLRYAVIEITNRCNLRCPHCASTSGQARDDELSLEEIRRLVADIARLGGEEITIIGGEALLRPDWFEICSAVVEAGLKLLLITNGLRLSRDRLARDKLRELRPYLIGISIDGASRESYQRLRGVDAFDEVRALCGELVADGHQNVNAITTFWKANLREFWDMADLFRDRDITWQVQIANKGGERFDESMFLSLEDYRWLGAQMRDLFVSQRGRVHLRHMDDFGYFPLDPALRFLHEDWQGCIAGVELIGVRSNADVLGCLSLGDGFVEANCRQRPLDEIWHSDQVFSRFRRKAELLTGHCAACAYAATCRGGCSSIAHSATGTIGCNPYCLRHLETTQILDELVSS